MTKNILIILNTDYHVEVALSIYKTLKLLDYNPTIFIIRPDLIKYDLLNYLFSMGVDFITDYVPGVCRATFSKAIVVSAYPTIEIPEGIPRKDYPIFEEFRDDQLILIAHRTGMEQNPIHKVLCVTPLAEKYNFQHIYLCENPSEKDLILQFSDPITFLIQGNFYANRRDLYLIDRFLDQSPLPKDRYKFVFIGDNREKPLIRHINHPSVVHLKNLTEQQFYECFNNTHFILPLISEATASSTYLLDRLSSSLSLAFCFNKPMILDKEINSIYNAPVIEYTSSKEFISSIEKCITWSETQYQAVVESCRDHKHELRQHNEKTLRPLLD